MKVIWLLYLIICIAGLVSLHCIHVKKMKKSHEQNKDQLDNDAKESSEKKKDDLQYILSAVNSWINNCDQKAGILLTVVGVAVTVFATSDCLRYLRHYIFIPFIDYWSGNNELSFSWGRFTVFCLLVIDVFLLIKSCYYLFMAISAKIDYEKMLKDNPGLQHKSTIYFGTISRMAYDEFQKDNVDYKEDLKSQIYVNSKIAQAKFQNYNRGLHWFILMLISTCQLLVATMIMV